ncbi:nicotinate-nucleotide--dimethylbenzimidazole phosphoribosyltransferase [Streptomyces sp. NPDC005438]|uniref:nicotinate-nucleotide--dimethylbenzimidazole phosphoribosyltransferase n=1 Tax=Streptomyces sp. NPDC005438 TaxID=3156880 RepID=UPI0033B9CC54
MTDTGQVPAEGQPEYVGAEPLEGQRMPAPDTYTFMDSSEDEELLMPGNQGAWQEPVESGQAPRPNGPRHGAGTPPNGTPAPPRRPLHMGPPVPEQSGTVRSLADRGPAEPQPAGVPTATVPTASDLLEAEPGPLDPTGVGHQRPQPVTGGETVPEYLDQPAELAGPQLGMLPGAGQQWGAAPEHPVASPQPGSPWPVADGSVPEPPAAPAEPVPQPPYGAGEFASQPPAHANGQPWAAAQPEAQPAPMTVDAVTPAQGAPTPDLTVPGAPGHAPVDQVPAPEPQQATPAQGTAHTAPAQQGPQVGPVGPEGEHAYAEALVAPQVEQPLPAGPPQQVAPAPADPSLPHPSPDPQAQAPVRPEPQPLPVPGPERRPAQEGQEPQGVQGVQPTPVEGETAAVPVPGPRQGEVVAEEPTAPQADEGGATTGDTPVAPEVAEGQTTEPQAAEVAEPQTAQAVDPQVTEPQVTGPQPSGPKHAGPAEPAPPVEAEAVAVAEEAPQVAPTPEEQPTPEAPQVPAAAVEAAQVEGAPAEEPPASPEGAQPPVEETTEGSVVLPAGENTGENPEQPAERHQVAEVAGSPEAAPTAPTEPVATEAGGNDQPETPEAARPAPEGQAEVTEETPQVEPAPVEPGMAPAEETAAQAEAPTEVEEGVRVAEGAPAAGYADAEREAVHRLMRERRDIRNGFRPDPIPHEVLLRVLEAAHTAPSVGHSQPWDFVVIRSEETRRTMHEMAQRQRDAYAASLPKGRAKQFKELKIEAIRETPVNIVVTADPTRGGAHTLGRHAQPQTAPYSSALAVENLWLAARAEGLGVGWVSFFDEREMVRALELPEHLEVVAYLCVGYVDEFPPEPELSQAGWSKRRPLSWVVHEESYGRRVLPGSEPHDLLTETLQRIRPLDAKALGEAWERQKRMTKPAGALGMLEILSAQLCGLSRKCPPPVPEPATVAVFAGDHGVHAQGVTSWPQEVTAQMVANFLQGGAVCNAFAHQVGAEVCVVDVGVATELPAAEGLLPRKVRAGTGDITAGPAMTREEASRALEVGIETARDLVAAGNRALLTGEMGIANTTASAALIAVYTGADPAEVTGRGTGVNDETHARKVEVVRRALELHQPDVADPLGVLAAVGGLEHAALVGMILGAASLRTPVILDGVTAGAAALVARAIAPEAMAACVAGHRSAEPGHVAALTKLGLRPLVDLDLRLGEGTGALLALPVVQSAARAMHQVATFDSAGVTEKS